MRQASRITGSRVVLREKRREDAWNDYTWEADRELAHLDAAEPLTIPFARYLAEYKDEMHNVFYASQRFAVETVDGKHIGNCSIYHINESRGEAELGIMIGDRDYWNKGYGTDIVGVLIDYVFRESKLKRIYLKTIESNSRAQKCFQKCGFVSCGRLVNTGFNFILMEIGRKEWQARQTETA